MCRWLARCVLDSLATRDACSGSFQCAMLLCSQYGELFLHALVKVQQTRCDMLDTKQCPYDSYAHFTLDALSLAHYSFSAHIPIGAQGSGVQSVCMRQVLRGLFRLQAVFLLGRVRLCLRLRLKEWSSPLITITAVRPTLPNRCKLQLVPTASSETLLIPCL